MTRLSGRSLQGERVYDTRPRNPGQNVSLLGALSIDGLIATISLCASVNTAVFVIYL